MRAVCRPLGTKALNLLMQARRNKQLKLLFTRTIKGLGRQRCSPSECAAGSLPKIGRVPQRGNCIGL